MSCSDVICPDGGAENLASIVGRLANASVGKLYCQNVRQVFGDRASEVDCLTLTIPEDCGLVFDGLTENLHGAPKVAGEFQLRLSYRWGSAQNDEVGALVITINPDPASLWKCRPAEPAGVFPKPDEAIGAVMGPKLAVAAASVRGRRHAHEGRFRDDDFSISTSADWTILIVADGAGSAKYSRRGSELACKTARVQLGRMLGEPNGLLTALTAFSEADPAEGLERVRQAAFPLLQGAMHASLAAIVQEATVHQLDVKEFHTTIIIVLATWISGKLVLIGFAIGDGGAGVLCDEERLHVLTQADAGEFAGQTLFLTTPNVLADTALLMARLRICHVSDFKLLAVMTDGVSDPIFGTDARFESAKAWEEWRGELARAMDLNRLSPETGNSLSSWLQFHSPGNHDDRTLIIGVSSKGRDEVCPS